MRQVRVFPYDNHNGYGYCDILCDLRRYKTVFPIIGVFAFALALVCAVVLIALRLTFSSGVIPEMVVGGEKNISARLKPVFLI